MKSTKGDQVLVHRSCTLKPANFFFFKKKVRIRKMGKMQYNYPHQSLKEYSSPITIYNRTSYRKVRKTTRMLFIFIWLLHLPSTKKHKQNLNWSLKKMLPPTWREGLLQLVSLLRVEHTQCVKVLGTANLELDNIFAPLDLNRSCILPSSS